MRKPLLAAAAALTLTLAPASAALAQDDDPLDNPVTEDTNKDDKGGFDDWGLLGLLGLLGLGGLAGRKKNNDTTVTRRTTVNERDTGTTGGASTR